MLISCNSVVGQATNNNAGKYYDEATYAILADDYNEIKNT